jgi:hypothetical protein
MPWNHRLGAAVAVALALASPGLYAAEEPTERQSLEEIRNTVVNLLRALVDKGLMTREQAEQLVKQAQDKAAADAATKAAQDAATAKADEGAVRVPYIPQIVKDEISKQVAQEVKPAVVEDVVKEAKAEKWGVPAALPDWLSRVKVFGDVTVRAQGDLYSKDNVNPFTDPQDAILDFNAINQAGGIAKTAFPFLNTIRDRDRMRLRARFGVEGDVSSNVRAIIRIASGSLTDPGSESQTLGNYAERYNVGLDQAYIVWDSNVRDRLSLATVQAGRIPNPWFSPTELVYARDLTFEGFAGTLRYGWGAGDADRSHVFATAGGFPVLEVPLVNQDNKWLVGGQLGTNLRWDGGAQHLRAAIAYYNFKNVTGKVNPQDSIFYNYTAPAFVRYGNTMFNISNIADIDPNANLWALAAHFKLADIAASYDYRFGRYSTTLTGEVVRNLGYNRAEVEFLSGNPMPRDENKGYVGEISLGDPVVDAFLRWRVAVGYRYVQRDAVLDAWTDADFHEGGTNTKGYYTWASLGVTHNTWLRLRYMSGNEIDGGQTYGLDIWQLDLNARF